MKSTIAINRISTKDQWRVDATASPSLALDGWSSYGFALHQTMNALGMCLDESTRTSYLLHANEGDVRAKKVDLEPRTAQIARYAIAEGGGYSICRTAELDEITAILGSIVDTILEVPTECPEQLWAKIIYPFAEPYNDDGLTIYWDREPHWLQPRAT